MLEVKNTKIKKILLVFGTRPEAIKMAPLVKEFQKHPEEFETKVCVTAQHRQMLDQVLEIFEIVPDFDLNIMQNNQDLYDISSKLLLGLREVLQSFKPDFVFVHGDTTTTAMSALAAFYEKCKIAHIEAGLRTNNVYSPFPEEANRQLVGVLANLHFAPTQDAKVNLLKENKAEENIIVTGNTVIDALKQIKDRIDNDALITEKIINQIKRNYAIQKNRNFILVTGHRRENFGEGFLNICKALKEIALKNPKFDIVYPVHLNPNVQQPVNEILSGLKNVYLVKPLSYECFIYMMDQSYFIITDSGGIQEEAPNLGKPVLVTRDVTERSEALVSGLIKLVGTDKSKIINETQKLIDNKNEYEKMTKTFKLEYGAASKKIINIMKNQLPNV